MSRFANFLVDSIAFEVRFHHKWSLWDRAGALWHDISGLWQNVDQVVAEPNTQAFTFGNYDVKIQPDRALLVQRLPDLEADDFAERCGVVYKLVVQHLEIKILTRIGLRIRGIRQTSGREEGAQLLRQTGLFAAPHHTFNVHGEDISLERIIVLEAGSRGVRLHIRNEERKWNFAVPFAMPADSAEASRQVSGTLYGAMADVDYYVRSDTRVGSFEATSWISDGVRVIARDIRALLRE